MVPECTSPDRYLCILPYPNKSSIHPSIHPSMDQGTTFKSCERSSTSLSPASWSSCKACFAGTASLKHHPKMEKCVRVMFFHVTFLKARVGQGWSGGLISVVTWFSGWMILPGSILQWLLNLNLVYLGHTKKTLSPSHCTDSWRGILIIIIT